MDFKKLEQEVNSLLAKADKPAEKPEAPVEKKMTAAEFGEYAKAQIAKAKTEQEGGKVDLCKARLGALKVEADKIAKFDYKPGELPNVTVYKDVEQLETTEEERSVAQVAANKPTGADNWTAKSANFSNLLGEALQQLGDNRPTSKETREETVKVEDADWPSDLAASIKKSKRDEDTDYHWGSDAR